MAKINTVALCGSNATRQSQINLLLTLTEEAKNNWQRGLSGSAYHLLKHLGYLFRITTDPCQPAECAIWMMSSGERFRLVIEALSSINVEQVMRYADLFLNKDERRGSKNRRWQWAAAFSNVIVDNRDRFQVVTDCAARFSSDFINSGESEICLGLTTILAELAELDRTLRKTPEAEEDVIRYFRPEQFVSPDYDLTLYWWFGPERQINPDKLSAPLWKTYGLPRGYPRLG
jgi:hypothetical protein